jgi:hypothetical protein
VTIDVEVPERSPLAALELAGRRTGLAGHLNVSATRPRRLRGELLAEDVLDVFK